MRVSELATRRRRTLLANQKHTPRGELLNRLLDRLSERDCAYCKTLSQLVVGRSGAIPKETKVINQRVSLACMFNNLQRVAKETLCALFVSNGAS